MTARALAASRASADPHAPHDSHAPRIPLAVLVSDSLRGSLVKFAGVDGFSSLLRRAVALVSVEVPALSSARVGADGRLEWPERAQARATSGAHASLADDGAEAMTLHLLGLLVTFLGEAITLRLVSDAWPGAPLDPPHPTNEATP